MLADALGLSRKQVIAEVVHQAETDEGELHLLGQDERLNALLDELIVMLERGAIGEESPRRLTIDPVGERQERELLRGPVLDKIARNELQASVAETAIVSAWPRSVARLAEIKKHVLETGESALEEIDLNLLGSDELRHYREAVEAQRDRAGHIVGVIGTKTAITEQHQAHQQLTEMVAFRERMMSVLGHDLRNPLTTIGMANARLLHRTDVSPGARAFVVRSQRAADRMQELIEKVLDFARARFLGTIPVEPVPSDLEQVARGVVEDSKVSSPDRRIELEVRGDAHGTWDPGRMAQIIANLVGNAITYGARHAAVTVEIDATGDHVVLSVHNEGPPIPPEILRVLFEPLRRGAEDKSPRGLGLGLYIVRQLVEAHGGTVDVRSTAQEGTTLTIHLPRAPPPTPPRSGGWRASRSVTQVVS